MEFFWDAFDWINRKKKNKIDEQHFRMYITVFSHNTKVISQKARKRRKKKTK